MEKMKIRVKFYFTFTLFTSKHVSVRCENFFIHCQSASSSLVMLLDHLVHFLWGLPTK